MIEIYLTPNVSITPGAKIYHKWHFCVICDKFSIYRKLHYYPHLYDHAGVMARGGIRWSDENQQKEEGVIVSFKV